MEELEKYFHGIRAIIKNDEYFQPVRFLNEEIDYYSALGESFKTRAFCSAGITLQFYTEEKDVSFNCKIENFIRNKDSISVYEDGYYSKSYYYSEEKPLTQFSYHRKSEGKGKIVIYLPSLSSLSIKDFSLAGKSPVEQKSKTILCYGDSITQGIEPQNSSAAYTYQIARCLDFEVINLAIGGHYFDVKSLINRIENKPDLIIIGYGTNDFSVKTLEEIEDQIEKYLSKIREFYPISKVYCISPLWRFDIENNEMDKMNKIRDMIKFESAKNNMNYVNGFDLLDRDKSLFTDRIIHPNDLGFTMMADRLLEIIKK